MPFSKHEFNFFIYWHILHSSGFHHICNIICRLDCRYSPQNIFNAKKFNPHKKSTSLLNVPICTHGMQRTWWPEAGTIIVSGPYWMFFSLVGSICCYSKLWKKSGSVSLLPGSLRISRQWSALWTGLWGQLASKGGYRSCWGDGVL